MLKDIEIAQQASMRPISEIAAALGINESETVAYGRYKCKLTDSLYNRIKDRTDGRLILVTAVNPTPAGEGKTTTTVGLGQAFGQMGLNAIIALREPSLGPVFGVKGGAAGGGYSQVVPMEDINLHFTGDIHAVTAANNLLSAMIDNSLHQGNPLGIDQRRVVFKRVLDINDRELRNIVVGLGNTGDGIPRQDGFMISVASEIMAVLCLAADIPDLKARLGRIIVAYTAAGAPVYCRDLKAEGALAALLREAMMPNLVQTLENTPVLIHGGPFANIAHGCNSVRATRLGLKLCDYLVTEAGFGSDLGAEKFFDIKCRAAGLMPACAVLVATVRALKYNGGLPKSELAAPNTDALRRGLVNLEAHLDNLKKFGVPVVVAINRFLTDSEEELKIVKDCCTGAGARFALSDVFAKGGAGGLELAAEVKAAAEGASMFKPLYSASLSIKEKIDCIARGIYGASGVSYSPRAEKDIKLIEGIAGDVPVCIAKTQYSLSDDPALLGRPSGFKLNVEGLSLSNGAGFVVALAGNIMTMPGLPKQPAAENIDLTDDGRITGLF